MQRIPMYMKDWIERLHEFLQINRKNILKDAGRISHELATEIAEKNFDEYQKIEARKMDNDFDKIALRAIEMTKKRNFQKRKNK